MKTLITGAGGVLGSYLKGDYLRADKRNLDITDYEKVEEYLSKHKPECIIHLASMLPNCMDEDWMYEVNVNATENLIKTAKKNGLKRFIFTSSCAVYHQEENKPTREDENIAPKSLYGATKLMAEDIIRKEFDNAVIFRIFNIYGGKFRHSLINKLQSDEMIQLYSPSKYLRDYIYYADVVKYIEMAINLEIERTEVFNLGSGRVRSTQEILSLMEQMNIEPNCQISDKGEDSVSWANIEKLTNYFGFTPRKGIVFEKANSYLEIQ